MLSVFFKDIPSERFVKVRNSNIRYCMFESSTQDNYQSSTNVILLHGGGASLDWWAPNLNAIAENHCVYALDLIGSGYSDKPKVSYSFDYLAEFIKDFMDTLDIESAVLVGQSAGGGVALKFAINFPERIEKLILISSVGLDQRMTFGMRLATLPLIGEFMTYPHRNIIAQMMKQAVFNSDLITEELIEFSYQTLNLPQAQAAYLNLLRSNGNFWGWHSDFVDSITSNLKFIQTNTLIIWGEQDKLVPIDWVKSAIEHFPNAHLSVFKMCGHWPSIEHSEMFNKLVCEFLGSVEKNSNEQKNSIINQFGIAE